MKVPKNFKTRIAGNLYENTPDLIVCSDTTILRVDRDETSGELLVKLAIFDSGGRRKALVEGTKVTKGSAKDYSIKMTDQAYAVREVATGRDICKLQRCAANRDTDIDAFVLTHTPDGFFIHANPVQTNIGTKATGQTYQNLDAALVMK